uniref:PX domain-containing protein kinase-like protein n=3 Tax=Callithrix jacchus TaxID=9483 RepID=A0A8I4A4N3_CALJA
MPGAKGTESAVRLRGAGRRRLLAAVRRMRGPEGGSAGGPRVVSARSALGLRGGGGSGTGGARTPRARQSVGRRVLTAAALEPGGRRESALRVPASRPWAAAAGRPGMAFMEKPPAGKVLLDDTVPLTAAIEASQSLQSHTEYIIRVQRGISVENSWQIAGLSLPLPPKKLIGNMDREFIAERQKGLQNYLNVITTNHILSNCELVKKFLDPNNYSANYTEIALQQVSMFFRSEPKWEVVEPLKDIGWRIRKKYFLMKIKNQPKERLVLSWADLGPDKYLSDKDFQCLIKLLPSCLHPYIYRVTFATANESSTLLIRMFNEKGTLKDLIYKAKPKDPFLKKYCNPKKIQGLELQQIKTYGRQILEVLKFLHDKGFPYGHLHASNVMLDGDTCRLLDLENSLLGLPSFYRSYFSQFRKINTLESVDVHCFGHLLYEMTYGRPPDSVPVDSFPPAPSMAVVAVLESTLSCEACKNGMPTVSRLLQMPLFSDVLLTTSEKPQFKIPTKLKEALRIAKECIEKRLIEEQKQIHQHRRLTRAQSHHGSEEERKKRKILARKKSKRSALENSEEHSAKYSNSNNSAGSGASSPLTSPSSPTPPSTSGISALPPPPPPLPPPAAPLPPASTEAPAQLSPQAENGVSRGALLSSIQNFQKGTLRKAETCDHSAPKIG